MPKKKLAVKGASQAKSKIKRKVKSVGTRPFASQAQWRLFFANPKLRRYALRKAHASGGNSAVSHKLGFSPAYRRLPPRKGSTIARIPTGKGKRKKR